MTPQMARAHADMWQEEKARADTLLAALQEWKCPSCGGAKTYVNRSTFGTSVVPCRVCKETGLHPTALAAIAKATGQ